METMRAITVEPGVPRSLRLENFRVPGVERGTVLARAVALGVCATDREITDAKYGAPPPGHKRLIIGHESLGRVVEAPAGSGIARDALIVGFVRHPDPVPCTNCAVGEWDMCSNGRYTERGIKGLDGFGAEYFRIEPEFVVPVDEDLGFFGVLTEPASVVAKAWEHIEHIGQRAAGKPDCALVTGAGPVGLLAALFATQRGLEVHVLDHHDEGPKPDLVRRLGATYHSGELRDLRRDFDVVIEATGAAPIIGDIVGHTSPNAMVCLLGMSAPYRKLSLDVGRLNTDIVLGNRVMFGSVNANRRHYESALRALSAADRSWLEKMITRRVPLDNWREAFDKHEHDVKTVIDFAS